MRIERILLPTLLATVAFAQSWAPVPTQNAPPPQGFQQSLAWHAPSGRTLLHGGRTSAPLSETWLFDGTDWVLAQPVTDPGPRWGHRLVHDSRRGVVVLWGGRGADASGVPGTWEWNGADWQQVPTATEPPLRAWHQMAFDQRRGVAVVFGGFASTDTRTFGGVPGRRGASGLAPADTWEFDGTRWHRIAEHAPGGPVETAPIGVVVFPHVVVAIAGPWVPTTERPDHPAIGRRDQPPAQLRRRRVPRRHAPPVRIYPALCFDPLRGAIVAIGGVATTSRRGTVLALHDAVAGWHECAPACGPRGRAVLGMTVRALARGTRLELDPGLRGAAVPVVLAMLPASAVGVPACEALPAADALELPVGGLEFAGCDTALRAFLLERGALRASAAWSYRP